jgi:hypothetical protein
MNLRRITAALALAGCLGFSGAARAELPSELAPFSAQGQAAAQKHWAALKAAGLGDELLGDRVREWQAKGADEALVLSLLGRWAEAAPQAREVIDNLKLKSSPTLVETATAALVGGAGREPLFISLRGATTADEVRDRALALTTLMAQGFPPEPSAQTVSAAAGRGFQGKDLNVLVGTAQRLVHEGAAPGEPLLARMTEAVKQGISATLLYGNVQKALGPARAVRAATPEAGYNHVIIQHPSAP